MILSALLLAAVELGLARAHPAELARSTPDVSAGLSIKGADGKFTPYQSLDVFNWQPDSSVYDGVPMLTHNVTVDGKEFTYQDFDVAALTLEQFKKFYMSTEQFVDTDGHYLFTDEEAEAYKASLIAAADDEEAPIVTPQRLRKRAYPDACFYDNSARCKDYCIDHVYRSVRQGFNNNVYGYYHYVSDALCGTGSVSKTVSVTHTSSVSIGLSGQIPGFGKGWKKGISTFFSTFGINIGAKTPDSVTTGISYTGSCSAFSVCFLWERPRFSVDKGTIITQNLDVNSRRACSANTVSPYEVHIMHEASDPGGAGSHGMCYSMGYHGCSSKPRASATLDRCPDGY